MMGYLNARCDRGHIGHYQLKLKMSKYRGNWYKKINESEEQDQGHSTLAWEITSGPTC